MDGWTDGWMDKRLIQNRLYIVWIHSWIEDTVILYFKFYIHLNLDKCGTKSRKNM
jgi:hypothetical protein